jgi:Fic family protein
VSFNPNYIITDTLLNYLTAIASGREFIEHAPLYPSWEITFRRKALLHNTHSSTAIEGNRLDFGQVEALASGKQIVATDRDKKEVLNYIDALEKIPVFAQEKMLSQETLLNIHKTITVGILNSNDCGKFRTKQVFVGKRVMNGTQLYDEVEYMPPPPEDVRDLVSKFCVWLNREKTLTINPVLLSGIAHYEIARIHPFIDGNGRTSRLFASLLLYKSGFDHRRFFALDDFYDHDRQAYYNALKTVDKETRNLTQWLEYFSRGVLFSINEVKKTIENLGIKGTVESKMQIILTPRQTNIVEYLAKNRIAANKNFQILFNISAQAVHKELLKLVDLQIIRTKGNGRSRRYLLVDD